MSAARKLVPISVEHQFQAPSLVSPGLDVLFVGGLSIAMFLLSCVLFPRTSPDAKVAMFVFNLSFIFNFPHFLVSYQLLYGDFRREIRKKFRFFWAAVIAPAIIGGGMIAAYAFSSQKALGGFLNAMYFFVGWHYVKQTFGAMVVSNAMKKTYYTSTERFWLKANMYSLWMVSFCAMNTGISAYAQMGVPYYSLNFPPMPLSIAYAAMLVSIAGVVITHLQKFVREGSVPSPIAIFSYLTIYVWLLPVLAHPMYAHMIPMFHSLQYLLFVYAFRNNKTEAAIENKNTPEGRRQWLFGVWGYLLGAVALGALSFHIIPTFLDSFGLLNTMIFGPTPFVFFATIFINIHHYFIDNVIWRGDNAEIRQHLFKAA